MRSRLVFMVGCWRSGTTWLWRSLASHPDVLGLPESHVLTSADRPGGSHAEIVRDQPLWRMVRDRSARTSERREVDPHALASCEASAVDGRFLAALEGPLGERLRQLEQGFESYPSWPGVAVELFRAVDGLAPVILEKTPGHVFALPNLHVVFPEARVIGVLRDARDVYCSVRALDTEWARRYRRLEDAARFWARAAREMLTAKARQPEQVSLVRYEDMQADYPRVLSLLFQFLGVEADAARIARIQATNSFDSYTGRRSGTALPGSFYRSGTAGGFARELSAAELARFDELLGTVLDRLGYPREISPRDAPIGMSAS